MGRGRIGRRLALLAVLLFLLIILAGCSKPAEVTCNAPYIKVGAECCLDQNSNRICDNDEPALTTPTTSAAVNQTILTTPTASGVICNKPYILVGTSCCLDKNDNMICDSDESAQPKTEAKAVKKVNAEELLGSLVTIIARFPVNVERATGEIGIDEVALNASGFIVSEEGHIITNAHVVEDYIFNCFLQSEYINRRFTCKLQAKTLDGETFDLDWNSVSGEWDMAVLRIKGASKKFEPLELAWESGKTGDPIFVLGAPEGLEFSITKGIISQKNRDSSRMPEDKTYSKYMQTDAAVNPGNSGGPIINEEGKVVGMATYGYLLSEGLNFGLQSEIISRLYRKTFNETTQAIIKTGYLENHDSDSYLKDVKVWAATDIDFITQKREVSLKKFKIRIDNNRNMTLRACFNIKLVTWTGLVDYDQTISEEKEVKPKNTATLEFNEGARIVADIDLLYLYVIDVFDCDTGTAYGKAYGPSAYI